MKRSYLLLASLFSGLFSLSTFANSASSWPQKYIPIPYANSAIQFVVNPNAVATYDSNSSAGGLMFPFNLPLKNVNGSASKSGTLDAQAKATQIGFSTLSHTQIGDVKTEVIADFWGAEDTGINTAYRPRLILGNIQVAGFLIGQTGSNFLDYDATGNTVDYAGIFGDSFFQSQLRYTFNLNPKTSISIAAERPRTDYTDNTGARTNAASSNGVPDVTMHLKHKDSFGHVTLRGVLRELKIKDHSDIGVTPVTDFSARKIAWGLGVSGKLFIYKKTNVFAQFNWGDGIGRYIIICNGQSSFYDASRKIFDKQKAYNGIIGLEHFWTDCLRSNFIYAHTLISTSKFTTFNPTTTNRVSKRFNQAFVNLLFSPISNLDVGIEYGYARRKTTDDSKGIGNRIAIGAAYRL